MKNQPSPAGSSWYFEIVLAMPSRLASVAVILLLQPLECWDYNISQLLAIAKKFSLGPSPGAGMSKTMTYTVDQEWNSRHQSKGMGSVPWQIDQEVWMAHRPHLNHLDPPLHH